VKEEQEEGSYFDPSTTHPSRLIDEEEKTS
jgi:hypothetical protein